VRHRTGRPPTARRDGPVGGDYLAAPEKTVMLAGCSGPASPGPPTCQASQRAR